MVNEISNIAVFVVILIVTEVVFLNNKKLITTIVSLFLILLNVANIFMGMSICHSLLVIALCVLNMGIVYYSNE